MIKTGNAESFMLLIRREKAMQSDNSADYYRAREQSALSLAQAAADEHIRGIHLEMAREYERLATLHSSYGASAIWKTA